MCLPTSLRGVLKCKKGSFADVYSGQDRTYIGMGRPAQTSVSFHVKPCSPDSMYTVTLTIHCGSCTHALQLPGPT